MLSPPRTKQRPEFVHVLTRLSPSTLNPQPSTLNPQPSTLTPHPRLQQRPELVQVLTRVSANVVVLKLAHNSLASLPRVSMPHLLVLDLSFNELRSAASLPRAEKLKVRQARGGGQRGGGEAGGGGYWKFGG